MKKEACMELFESIQGILTEILDLEDTELTPETYLIRDLGAESIDLIEIAVAMSYRFKIQVEDDEAFLKNFRLHLMEAQQKDLKPADYLAEKYPFLSRDRVEEIISDLERGPAVKLKDLICYVAYRLHGAPADERDPLLPLLSAQVGSRTAAGSR